MGYGKFQTTDYPTYKHDTSDYGFSYGAGLQFNPMENVALTSLTSRAVFVALTLAPDCWRRLPLLITSVKMKNPPFGADFFA